LFSGTSVGEEAVASGKVHKNSVMATKPTLLLALPRYPDLLSRAKRDMLHGKVEFISNISIFSGLTTPEQLQLLAEQLSVVRVAENTPVCREGTPITHMLFVKRGHLRTLKVIQHCPGGGSASGSGASMRPGRNLLIEVQRLAPNHFFGENSFRHMPINTMRSMRRPGSIKRNKLGTKSGENKMLTYGTYLASLVSTTYCELFEVPISMVHAILSREAIATLTEYGDEREKLYASDSLERELVNTLKMNKEREVALTSQNYVSRT
jgi:CRP-like cAMP-binding protein